MMAAAPVKGSLQGRAGCPQIFLSARDTDSTNYVHFPHNHPLQQRGGVFQSLAWNADGNRRGRKLKAQEPDQMPLCRKPFFSDANFVDPQAPTSYIDVLKMSRPCHPPQVPMCEELEQHENVLQQRARKFVDGIIQSVSSEKEYYKFIIIACKENTNVIMEMGFISCYNRDDILHGLAIIEDDIARERFEWKENKDVRSNIVEALVERVGEPARKLDATTSQYVQKLTILRLWFHDSADTIITQIEQLQVELVLLALRNWGFVVPLLFRRTDWILLGELILSIVELLERDVSRLRSCRNEIDSTLHITLPLCNTDACLDRSFNDASHILQNAVINFGNMIIGNIAIDISTLKREMSYWTTSRFLTMNDRVRESISLLNENISDLSKLATIQSDPFTCYHIKKLDTSQRFLAVHIIVQKLLKEATYFAKVVSFNRKKTRSFPSFHYIGTAFSSIDMVKVNDKDESEKATKEFGSRNDETMKRLVDWLAKHHTMENPLKFSQFEFE